MNSRLDLPRTSGVYLVNCLANRKGYIGSARDFQERWREHKRHLRNQTHHNKYLQNAWNKYGESAFTFSILEECPKEILYEREQYHLDVWFPTGKLFNLSINAKNPTLGRKHRPETLEKMRAAKLGKKRTPEARARQSAATKGRKLTPEALAKRTAALQTPEARANMSKAQKGRKHSPETLAKIKSSNKRVYIIVSPDGVTFESRAFGDFCREHGLNHSMMCAVVRGDRPHHRQWKAKRIDTEYRASKERA